jgi:hypothetical protein
MKLILPAMFMITLICVPVLLGWALRGLLLWCFPQSQWHVDRGYRLRIAQLLCVLGAVVLALFWLSQLFSHAACMLAGGLFYGPGLFMLTFFSPQTETARN